MIVVVVGRADGITSPLVLSHVSLFQLVVVVVVLWLLVLMLLLLPLLESQLLLFSCQ